VANKVSIETKALEDISYWIRHDKKMALRIVRLISAIQRNPFEGIGKPEPLKHDLSGAWSRRIDKTHRIVYKIAQKEIVIIQCRFHY